MMRNITSAVSLLYRLYSYLRSCAAKTTVGLAALSVRACLVQSDFGQSRSTCRRLTGTLRRSESSFAMTDSLVMWSVIVTEFAQVLKSLCSSIGNVTVPYLHPKPHLWRLHRSLNLCVLLVVFVGQYASALGHSQLRSSPNSPVLNHRSSHLPHSPRLSSAPFTQSQLNPPTRITSDPLVSPPDAVDNEYEPYLTSLCDREGNNALGMESGRIPDSAISASSAYQMSHTGPTNARLKMDLGAGAWCPLKQVGPNTPEDEWIQVNLSSPFVITDVATQGRFGKGLGVEFTESFRILYSRQRSPTEWILWKNRDGRSSVDGNIDQDTVEEHHLEVPIVGARYIRLVPLSNHTRTVCLRFELYGCSYQGPIAYNSPVIAQTEGNSTPLAASHVHDDSYDGHQLNGSTRLVGGLGELVDGLKSSPKSDPTTDSAWVGWPKPNHSESASVELEFEFDEVQNFTTVSVTCLNSYSRHVRVFSVARVWFSLDRQRWSNSPIRFDYQADNVIELPRDVIIHLQYRIGRFVRIELTFEDQWLQVSEVSFECRSLSTNLSLVQVQTLFGPWRDEQADDAASAGGIRSHIMPEDGPHKGRNLLFPEDRPTRVKYSLIIVCLCTLGLVVISLLTSLILKKLNNRKNNVFREISSTDLDSENATINLKNLPKEASPLYCEPKEISALQEEAEYAIPDVICPSNLSKTLNFQKSAPNAIACKTMQINPRFYASSDIICAKPNIYGTRPGTQILNVFDITNLRALNPTQQYSKQSQPQPQQLSQQQQTTPLLDTFGGRKQSTVRSSFYGELPTTNGGSSSLFGVRVYSEAEIGVLQSLGKSKFGDVLLCNIPTIGKNRLAVVRTVNDLDLKAEFTDSMQFLRRLSLACDKFARLFGVIQTPTYFASITENADCDLNYYLRKSSLEHLSYETLLYIAGEIASAGAYLESSNHTHRDIATRNVIVYEKQLTVKLTDVAQFEDKYAADYYNGLPLRWMSPEAVVRTECTTRSDMYAFGVTLWEVLTLAKCRPFADLSDEDLITTIYQFVDSGQQYGPLPCPTHCSADIYELIEECCHLNAAQRPSFKEVCLFLQRKTLSFAKPIGQSSHM